MINISAVLACQYVIIFPRKPWTLWKFPLVENRWWGGTRTWMWTFVWRCRTVEQRRRRDEFAAGNWICRWTSSVLPRWSDVPCRQAGWTCIHRRSIPSHSRPDSKQTWDRRPTWQRLFYHTTVGHTRQRRHNCLLNRLPSGVRHFLSDAANTARINYDVFTRTWIRKSTWLVISNVLSKMKNFWRVQTDRQSRTL